MSFGTNRRLLIQIITAIDNIQGRLDMQYNTIIHQLEAKLDRQKNAVRATAEHLDLMRNLAAQEAAEGTPIEAEAKRPRSR